MLSLFCVASADSVRVQGSCSVEGCDLIGIAY